MKLNTQKNSLENHESNKNWVQLLEKKFSEVMGVKYCIACNSGTSGLHAALYRKFEKVMK